MNMNRKANKYEAIGIIYYDRQFKPTNMSQQFLRNYPVLCQQVCDAVGELVRKYHKNNNAKIKKLT